ncbi:MAG: hypothetical protein IKP60_13800 [Treponema sp.]|nr:hypothetical protein [Treponema sp.]
MRKYKCGERIKSIADFENKSKILDFFVVGTRTTHKAWIESWQYRTLRDFIMNGKLYEALPVDYEALPVEGDDK